MNISFADSCGDWSHSISNLDIICTLVIISLAFRIQLQLDIDIQNKVYLPKAIARFKVYDWMNVNEIAKDKIPANTIFKTIG